MFNKFNDFAEQLVLGKHAFDGSQVFNIMLTNVAPVATNTGFGDLTEIAAGNGYSAGGSPSVMSESEVGGVVTVLGTQVTFLGTGLIDTFRYAVLYNVTAAGKPLVGWWDYGGPVVLNNTDQFTVKFSNADPGAIFTLA